MSGDREGLFLCQLDTLRRFVRLLVRDEETANELLQDVAVVVLEHCSGPRDLTSFPFWCRGIARRLVLHRRRSLARLASCIEALEALRTQTVIDDLERSLIARQELVTGLQALDEVSQDLLFEYVFSGAGSTELAARWNISPAALRMRLTRLRSELRAAAQWEENFSVALRGARELVRAGGSPPRCEA